MLCQRLCLTGALVAVVTIVMGSGDAEARCGCRNHRAWRSNGGYSVGGNQYNGYNNGYATTTSQPMDNSSMNGSTAPAPQNANGTTMQTDNNYSVGRPTYVNQNQPATQVIVPNQGNTVPNNRPYPAGNPSPDVDNSARNLTTSSIPGTSPSKAPEPPAAAAAPR